ncbi:hypothetical protein FLAG1_01476 [Fusarium langsethiae]|uniref:Uncharacterized protein n=1 Tax=Fusarium langsethiae TaxID=179993 RepID=A0A0M9F3X6_FUSLA|nr:hypothetical protein FLAG1_01476 [Fusarium langsethiae]GKU00848.1 unnamed protein product [Fusarium langsethiae]GKU17387.1 unnamed protein product [Fusarium langsethiae]
MNSFLPSDVQGPQTRSSSTNTSIIFRTPAASMSFPTALRHLQEAALRVGKGEIVNNWDELVAQFKQAIERGAAPQAGPRPVNLAQTNARAEPRRENPRRSAVASGATPRREGPPQEVTRTNSRLGNASAQTAPEIPLPIAIAKLNSRRISKFIIRDWNNS